MASSTLTGSELPETPTVPQVIDHVYDLFEGAVQSAEPFDIQLPADLKEVVGEHGVQTLVNRFSEAIGFRIEESTVFSDERRMICLRATDEPVVEASEDDEVDDNAEDDDDGGDDDGKQDPRPSNSFILFRQHHELMLKAACPSMHNILRAKVIGGHWRKLPKDNPTKIAFTRRAKWLRDYHKNKNPNYAYNPKKAAEKRRRMTKKKARLAHEVVAEILDRVDVERRGPLDGMGDPRDSPMVEEAAFGPFPNDGVVGAGVDAFGLGQPEMANSAGFGLPFDDSYTNHTFAGDDLNMFFNQWDASNMEA